MPELLDVDRFYCDMFTACGARVVDVRAYCELFGLGRDETVEALEIMRTIATGVE